MKKFLLFNFSLLLIFCSQSGFSQGVVYAENEKEHYAKVLEWRKQKDENYKIKEKTMLSDELFVDFAGLNYYNVSYSYRIIGKLKRFAERKILPIQTTGGQVYDYIIFGQVAFVLNGKSFTLNVYQSQRSAKAGTKKGALFIPFTDNTSANETFGGGRYLVLDIPDSDQLTLDFNMAYNPYCVYDPEHSCPIPPRENNLEVAIEAGELMYE
jgi:uncharacterized protein